MALHLPLICSCTELTCLELELGSTRNGLIVSCVGEWVCVGPLQLKSIKQAVSTAAIAKSSSALSSSTTVSECNSTLTAVVTVLTDWLTIAGESFLFLLWMAHWVTTFASNP